jgi:hypothetical protein
MKQQTKKEKIIFFTESFDLLLRQKHRFYKNYKWNIDEWVPNFELNTNIPK